MSRLQQTFSRLKAQNKAALVGFIMASDPDTNTTQALLQGLPTAGMDIIELGMPFSDPMADGPTIQAAAFRALQNKHTMAQTFALVQNMRDTNPTTPIILMGYYNPIYIYGVEAFFADAASAGVDGVIIVDLPAEERHEVAPFAQAHAIDIIPLIAPTTPVERLPLALSNGNGFVYFVSVAGITGAKAPDVKAVQKAVEQLKQNTNLPVCVGFGIRTPEQLKTFAHFADGVVVGSALVEKIAQLRANTPASSTLDLSEVFDFVKSLKAAS